MELLNRDKIQAAERIQELTDENQQSTLLYQQLQEDKNALAKLRDSAQNQASVLN